MARPARIGTSSGSGLSGTRFERRIGTRYPVSLFQLTWQPELPKKWFRRSTKPERATIVDLSVTGACIQAPANDEIQRGTTVRIAFGGAHRGVVRVQRVEVAPGSSVAYYGVQFVSLDAALQQLINDAVGDHRPSEHDWR